MTNTERFCWGTPLDLAVEGEQDHTIEYLLQRGANIDLVSDEKCEYALLIQQKLAKQG